MAIERTAYSKIDRADDIRTKALAERFLRNAAVGYDVSGIGISAAPGGPSRELPESDLETLTRHIRENSSFEERYQQFMHKDISQEAAKALGVVIDDNFKIATPALSERFSSHHSGKPESQPNLGRSL